MELPEVLGNGVASQEDITDSMGSDISIYECSTGMVQSNVKKIFFKELKVIHHFVCNSDVVIGKLEFLCENNDVYCFDDSKQLSDYFQPVKKKGSNDNKRYYINIAPFQWTQLYKDIVGLSSDD